MCLQARHCAPELGFLVRVCRLHCGLDPNYEPQAPPPVHQLPQAALAPHHRLLTWASARSKSRRWRTATENSRLLSRPKTM
eukprot:2338833-Amphidinium_carterae.1